MSPANAKRNICILTTQRSGSTWLMQLLNDTGQVRAYGEVFLEWATVVNHPGDKKLLPPMFFADFVKSSESPRVSDFLKMLEATDDRPVAFKIMYDQVRRNPAILITPMLRGYTIVHLRRGNLLDIVMSRLLARATRIYHSSRTVDLPKVGVSAGTVMAMLKRIDRHMRLAKLVLAALPINKLDLLYENLAERPQEEIDRLLSAIGISMSGLRQTEENWIKTNTRRPEQVFENYESIASRIRSSRFSWMLNPSAASAPGRTAPRL